MIQHSPVSMVEYYISKLFSALLTFLLPSSWSSVGHCPWSQYAMMTGWQCSHLVGSMVFIAMGVLVSLPPSAQLMSVVGNIRLYGFSSLGWALAPG